MMRCSSWRERGKERKDLLCKYIAAGGGNWLHTENGSSSRKVPFDVVFLSFAHFLSFMQTRETCSLFLLDSLFLLLRSEDGVDVHDSRADTASSCLDARLISDH